MRISVIQIYKFQIDNQVHFLPVHRSPLNLFLFPQLCKLLKEYSKKFISFIRNSLSKALRASNGRKCKTRNRFVLSFSLSPRGYVKNLLTSPKYSFYCSPDTHFFFFFLSFSLPHYLSECLSQERLRLRMLIFFSLFFALLHERN